MVVKVTSEGQVRGTNPVAPTSLFFSISIYSSAFTGFCQKPAVQQIFSSLPDRQLWGRIIAAPFGKRTRGHHFYFVYLSEERKSGDIPN